MKKQRFKIKRILPIGILVGLTAFITTCELEQDLLNDKETLTSDLELSSEKSACKKGDEILELSYVIETTTRFLTDQENFSDLDIASMTPKKHKQKINLKLYENGQISMIIEQKAFKNPIKIPHKTLPNDIPEVYKTIIENNTASFYDKNGNLLSTNAMEIPDHTETVNRLLELSDNCCTQEAINQTVARLQGCQFVDNLDEFISESRRNGARVMQEDEQFVTMRMSLGQIEPGMTDEVVVLIDKEQNRPAGTRVYNCKGELLLSTLFGYGPPGKPFLTAIKQQAKETLPSGAEIIVESYSKIDNIKFKVNI